MQVAIYARVSTSLQQQEGTIDSQLRALRQHIHQKGWNLLPEHEYVDNGISGGRLDRPALDRLRDCAQRGEFDALVLLSPDRLARNYAHQWLLIEEFEKHHLALVFLQNPFGNTPQGKLLTQMQGMIAEYERAQIVERTRRGRLEKARKGEFIPWAYHCYGYRYFPKRPGSPPQVQIEPNEAEVVRDIYRALVEEQLSCRQITKRLNHAKIPTRTGKSQVWHAATVRNILTSRVYSGQARFNYRQSVPPAYRNQDKTQCREFRIEQRYRPESECIFSESPAIISPELYEKAQLQLQRNAVTAQKLYKPASHRYLLRTLVKCGECGLRMNGVRQFSTCKKYEYFYYVCKGHDLLTTGRITKCPSKRVRSERLDVVVWQALCELLQKPETIPQLHRSWADSKQKSISALDGQAAQLLQRKQRLERQDQRLLDAYQAEIINLPELQSRRQKILDQLQEIELEIRQMNSTRQEAVHWQEIIEKVNTFHSLLGQNLEKLSFEEKQSVARCLIEKVIVTGSDVDIHFILPFESAPQVCHTLHNERPEGPPGDFYWLRLADLNLETCGIIGHHLLWRQFKVVGEKHHAFLG